MEVVVARMKNILIIAQLEGGSDIPEHIRVFSVAGIQESARDVNVSVEAIASCGYVPYVCYPREKDVPASYKYFGRYLSEKAKFIEPQEIKNILPECKGVIMMGMVAKAGTGKAFFDETYTPDFWDYRINGESRGFIGICKEFFAMNDIPVVMGVGCQRACDELQEECEGALTVVNRDVEWRFIHNEKEPVEKIREKIGRATRQALAKLPSFSVKKKEYPLHIDIEFMREDVLEDFLYCRGIEGFTRTGARNAIKDVEKTDDLEEFLGKF